MSAPEILAAAAEGRIKALWIVSDHWLRSAPDRALAEKALEQAELVIVNELFLTDTAARAHVVFPVTSFAEKEGVVVDSERRLQKSVRALPPRRGTRPDWEVFQAVAQAMGARWSYRTAEDVFREIAQLVPTCHGMLWATLLPEGVTWSQQRLAPGVSMPAEPSPAAGEGLALLSGGVLFLQGSLSHHSRLLPHLAQQARAYLHPEEAARLEVGEGEPLELAGPAGRITLPAALDASVPAGSVFVPYAYPAVELNRLGLMASAPTRVKARRVAAMAAV